MFKEALFRVTTQLFLPGLAKKMEEDGMLRLYEGKNAVIDESEYVLIEDRGAPLTVFIYSGLDALFAGEPRFEFRKQLSKLDMPFNAVFFRELRRMAYHVAPDGSGNGLEFYEAKTRELMQRLGAKVNVSMGSSGGGAAAMYFGTRCAMDHIIAFSPGIVIEAYTGWLSQARTYLDIAKLIRTPNEYVECVLVAISVAFVRPTIVRATGGGQMWDVAGTYDRAGAQRPGLSMFYGERCHFDCSQADMMAQYSQVRRRPVPTGRHNTPLALKQQGLLGTALCEELTEVLKAAGFQAGPAAS